MLRRNFVNMNKSANESRIKKTNKYKLMKIKWIGICTLSAVLMLAGCKKDEKVTGYVDNSPQIIDTIDGVTYQIEKCTEEDFTKEEIESTGGFWKENTEGNPEVLGKLVAVDGNGDRDILDRLVYYKDGECRVISTEDRIVYIGYPQVESLNYKGRVYVSISYDGSSRNIGEAKDTPNIENLQYIDHYLYYSEDGGSSVCRMNSNLQDKYLVGQVPGDFVTVAGNSIYYWNTYDENNEKESGIYRQTLSGSETDVFVQGVGIDNIEGSADLSEWDQQDKLVSIKGTLTSGSGEKEEIDMDLPVE
ncbi:MAG: hypothetical protein EOM18_01955 [Clostridia bacterium]|nr:hypothetical protein [Clostridia bacterium]